MKRIKLDDIHKTLDNYVRKRNYCLSGSLDQAGFGSESQASAKREFADVKDMALYELALMESTIEDHYIYSPCSISDSEYLKQYSA